MSKDRREKLLEYSGGLLSPRGPWDGQMGAGEGLTAGLVGGGPQAPPPLRAGPIAPQIPGAAGDKVHIVGERDGLVRQPVQAQLCQQGLLDEAGTALGGHHLPLLTARPPSHCARVVLTFCFWPSFTVPFFGFLRHPYSWHFICILIILIA